MVVAALIILFIVVFISTTASFWVNWWWFESIGYQSVLMTRYLAWTGGFIVGGVLATGFFVANWRLAMRRARIAPTRPGATPRMVPGSRFLRNVLWLLSAAIFFFAGAESAGHWETWLLALVGGEFGVTDPIFGRDAGFYVFRLPALALIQQSAIPLVLVTLVVVLVVYALLLGLRREDVRYPPLPVRTHVLALIGALLLAFGAGYLITNYQLQYSTRGVVFGAGFTDAVVDRWVNYAQALISGIAAVLMLLNARIRRVRWLGVAFLAWGFAAVVGEIVPNVVQQTVVEPSEIARERPYIENNIRLTTAAFALDAVETRDLTGLGDPPPAALSPTSTTFDNIRLWDYRVIASNYQTRYSFATYYQFRDVDIDRYQIGDQLRQVLISARELNPDGLQPQAQTWINRHLAYTHGYGAVVSPISESDSQGLPIMYMSAIPPESTGSLAITRPEIYFGEQGEQWVAVNTAVEEVSGIAEETNAVPYEGLGAGAIPLDNSLRRIIMATFLGDRRIMVSSELNRGSRILLRRQIRDRVQAIAPFLEFDADPYLVIADGRLIWVIDAYTQTNRFPGATPLNGINYVRNTVKATVDAYDGTITFYRTGAPDPIADAYGAIFGDLFLPIAEAPPILAAHFRYPERLFDIQAEVYANYHVTDPVAFYNGDVRWAIARERIEGTSRADDKLERMEAYYVTLPLPGEVTPGFSLVLPFTPYDRENMTAWITARADTTGVGQIVAYRFPRQSTVFGPQQIEARINQEPAISSQISLLDQAGSRVILGNLLIIPIDQTILYAQPLYLQATGTGSGLAELKFVIIATNSRVVMRPTLAEALTAIGEGGAITPPPVISDQRVPDTSFPLDADGERLAAEALAAYERGEAALARGDWTAYGQEQATLEAILRQLVSPPATPPATAPTPATPEPTPAATPVSI